MRRGILVLDQYIEGFLLHRESEGRSDKTLRWHRGSLSLFSVWLHANDLPTNPQQWDATLIRRYLVHLRERSSARHKPLSPQTIRNYASSIRAFCRWLHQEEITAKNATERGAQPQVEQLVKEPFSGEEAQRLLRAARSDRRNGFCDEAVVLFMLDSGCRASEVVGLRADDLIWPQRMAKVYGKGRKERVVFFSAETMRAMQKYAMRKRNSECDRFFQTEEGRALTPSGLLHITKRLDKRAKLTDVHPHRFRHTAAILFLRGGGNVLALQRLLGHTTLSMTQRYVAMVNDDLAREHREHSPVAALLSGR